MKLETTRKVQLLEKAFGHGFMDSKKENLSLRCPVCNPSEKDKLKLVVLVEPGWYKCWVCNTSGKNISNLFYQYSREHLGECKSLYGSGNLHYTPTAIEETVELPKDAKLLVNSKKELNAKDIYEYLVKRGLSKLDMYRWRIMFSNARGFYRKVIFPSFDVSGNLNYYVARSIDDSKFRYKNPATPSAKIIFNELDIDWTQPVILVEGIFDAIKTVDNAVPILGSSFTRRSELYKRLVSNQSTVIVVLDEGALKKSHKVCDLLHRGGCDVYQVKTVGGDLGSRDKKDALEVLRLAKPWTHDSLIDFKLSNIKSGSIL